MTDTDTTTAGQAGLGATFDFGHWRLDARQVASGATLLAFAVAAWARNAQGDRWIAVLVIAETGLHWLPWKLPRDERKALGYWAEAMTALISPVGAVIVGIAVGAPWLSRAGASWWYLVGLPAGVGLLALSGVLPSQIISGETAFVAGPIRRNRKVARVLTMSLQPLGEEALFRGAVLNAAANTSFGLLAAAAFVARHHVQPARGGRGSTRTMTVEIVAAAVFLLIVLESRSIYPALAAHLLVNIPGLIVELQRERMPVRRGEQ